MTWSCHRWWSYGIYQSLRFISFQILRKSAKIRGDLGAPVNEVTIQGELEWVEITSWLSNVGTSIGVWYIMQYYVRHYGIKGTSVLGVYPETWGDDRAVSEINFAKVSQNKYNIISKGRDKSTKNHKVTMSHKRLACHLLIERSNLKVYIISIIHKHTYRCNCYGNRFLFVEWISLSLAPAWQTALCGSTIWRFLPQSYQQ